MKILYSRDLEKKLKRIPQRDNIKILRKIKSLGNDPYSGKILTGEFSGRRSIRAWPYRIIYVIKGKTIYILDIAHRQNVYK